jgi:hypothetical protein
MAKKKSFRSMATIWKQLIGIIAKEYGKKEIPVYLWSLHPKNKMIYRDCQTWRKLHGVSEDDRWDTPIFWPNPNLKETEGYTKHALGGSYPQFGGYGERHDFMFMYHSPKIDYEPLDRAAQYHKSKYVGGFEIIQMPHNCGMCCLTDVQTSSHLLKRGIGTLLTEFAEAYISYSHFHAVIGTGVTKDYMLRDHDRRGKEYTDAYAFNIEEDYNMMRILDKRGWTRVAEFYNRNSGNIIATYQKEFDGWQSK